MRYRFPLYAACALFTLALGACSKPPVIPASSPTPNITQPTEIQGAGGPASTAADDLTAAVAFMKQNEFQPVILIGAGLGGSAAVRVASQDPNIAGVAIISAPKSFQGFELTDAEISSLKVSSLWLGARNDMTQ